MTDDFEFEFSSCELNVRRALERLRSELTQRPLSRDDIGSAEVVLGEVLNNVVEHAYGPGDKGTISLSCALERRMLRFRVVDRGRALPLNRLPEGALPPIDGALEEMPEGGFGWFLVRNLANDLTYERRSGKNILAFTIPYQGREAKGAEMHYS